MNHPKSRLHVDKETKQIVGKAVVALLVTAIVLVPLTKSYLPLVAVAGSLAVMAAVVRAVREPR